LNFRRLPEELYAGIGLHSNNSLLAVLATNKAFAINAAAQTKKSRQPCQRDI